MTTIEIHRAFRLLLAKAQHRCQRLDMIRRIHAVRRAGRARA